MSIFWLRSRGLARGWNYSIQRGMDTFSLNSDDLHNLKRMSVMCAMARKIQSPTVNSCASLQEEAVNPAHSNEVCSPKSLEGCDSDHIAYFDEKLCKLASKLTTAFSVVWADIAHKILCARNASEIRAINTKCNNQANEDRMRMLVPDYQTILLCSNMARLYRILRATRSNGFTATIRCARSCTSTNGLVNPTLKV